MIFFFLSPMAIYLMEQCACLTSKHVCLRHLEGVFMNLAGVQAMGVTYATPHPPLSEKRGKVIFLYG